MSQKIGVETPQAKLKRAITEIQKIDGGVYLVDTTSPTLDGIDKLSNEKATRLLLNLESAFNIADLLISHERKG